MGCLAATTIIIHQSVVSLAIYNFEDEHLLITADTCWKMAEE